MSSLPYDGGDLCRFRWSAATFCPLLSRARVIHGMDTTRLCTLHAWLDFESGQTNAVDWDDPAAEPRVTSLYHRRRAQMGMNP